jgi:putative copper export protein
MTTTILLVLARSAHFAGAMLLVALPFFAVWVARPALAGAKPETREGLDRDLRRWFWSAFLVEALSGVAWFGLAAAQIGDSPPWSLPDPGDLNALLLQTQFGHLWLGRATVLIVLFVFAAFAPGRLFCLFEENGRRGALLLAPGTVLLVSLAWAGHAAAGINDRATHLLADTLHLLLGAVWPVGLVPFALFLRQAAAWPRDVALAVTRRFSQTSFAVVFLLGATGLINGWLLVGSWSALVGTGYGRWLLAKVAVTLLMIGLGAWNRFVRLPQLAVAPEGASRYSLLFRNVVIETALAGIVLLIVGVMGMTPPPQ